MFKSIGIIHLFTSVVLFSIEVLLFHGFTFLTGYRRSPFSIHPIHPDSPSPAEIPESGGSIPRYRRSACLAGAEKKAAYLSILKGIVLLFPIVFYHFHDYCRRVHCTCNFYIYRTANFHICNILK